MTAVEVTQEVCAGCGEIMPLWAAPVSAPMPEPGQKNYLVLIARCPRRFCHALTEVGTGRPVNGPPRYVLTPAQLGPSVDKPSDGFARYIQAMVIGSEVCAACDSLLDFGAARIMPLNRGPRDVVVCPAPCHSMTEVGTGRLIEKFVDRDRGGMLISGVIRHPTADMLRRKMAHELETWDSDIIEGYGLEK